MKPTIGRIVHYMNGGVHYPAIVTKVWTPLCVNITVFPNGSDDYSPGANGAFTSPQIVTSVTYAAASDPTDRSWHWPEMESAD